MKQLTRICAMCALAVATVACSQTGTEDETTRENGEVVEGGDVGAFALQIGDCFDADAESSDPVESLPVVPCDEEHTGEIYHLFDLAEGDYPGDLTLQEEAQEGCVNAFAGYVGAELMNTQFDVSWLVPSEGGWNAIDDREIVCLLLGENGGRLTGSARGAGG